MVLLCWHLIATFFVGGDNPDIPLCKRLLAPLIENYPNGAIILFIRARLYLVSGDVDNAIYFYNKSIRAQDTYQQFHHICYWELTFAYSYLQKWDRAANNAKRLLDESKWSRCVYTYMLAIIIYADEHTPKRIETVRTLFQRVPNLRLRIAGKSIPVEKFCERKAQRFLRIGKLYFSHYEFIYFWCGFSICTPIFIENILHDIELKWRVDPSEDTNDQCLYMFLKGVCLKALRRSEEAETCFLKILELEGLLTDYYYIAPNACFELALTRAELGRGDEMEVLLTRALAYRGYSLETKLHFRIHGTLEGIRRNRGIRHLKNPRPSNFGQKGNEF
uniref:Tetratricopeptide repeat protein 39B n=1 Tax=Acrobeloides nanus TaxID=290746 RepID=A0A914E5Y7_9BILA